MTRARRPRPVMPPAGASADRALDRLLRLHRKDPEAAALKAAAQPGLHSALHARLAAERAREGDAVGALAEARSSAAVPGANPDAVAAALLSAAEAEIAEGLGEDAEALLLEAFSAALSSLGRGVALARLALLYRERAIPLGFRFYAPRALRVLDRGAATGMHPEADLDAARLACAVLEYHHRRDEPERSGRAFAVLDRVRDADPFTTVQGLKYHGLALGKLQEWEASWKVFAEAAGLAEEHDLRGCDGVFVYAAAVMVHAKDFAGARRLLAKVHIRRLDPGEKQLFRQFRHLVATAQEHRPLPAEKAEKFLRAQKRREKLAEKKMQEEIRRREEEAAAAAGSPVPPAAEEEPEKPAKGKTAAKKAGTAKKAGAAKKAGGAKAKAAAGKKAARRGAAAG